MVSQACTALLEFIQCWDIDCRDLDCHRRIVECLFRLAHPPPKDWRKGIAMPAFSANITNLITGGISFLLTLMVLSYLIGDNPVFRVAVYIFIGVSAGYVAVVAWHQVLYPRLIVPLLAGSMADRLLALIPLVLGLLFLFKLSPRTARLGNPSMAFLVGVGAAVAIGGAVLGTLFPQTRASMNALQPVQHAGQYWLEQLFEGWLC